MSNKTKGYFILIGLVAVISAFTFGYYGSRAVVDLIGTLVAGLAIGSVVAFAVILIATKDKPKGKGKSK